MRSEQIGALGKVNDTGAPRRRFGSIYSFPGRGRCDSLIFLLHEPPSILVSTGFKSADPDKRFSAFSSAARDQQVHLTLVWR